MPGEMISTPNPITAVGLAYLATLEQAFDVIRATDMTDEQIKYARRLLELKVWENDKRKNKP